MRIGRRRHPGDSWSRFSDEDTRLAAASERLDAEQLDLDVERERLARDRALAKHLDEGNLDRIVEREGKVAERLRQVEVELDELREARAEVARRAVGSAREIAEALHADRERNELEARVERGKAAEVYRIATDRHAEAEAALAAVRSTLAEVEADGAAVEEAITKNQTGPLGAVRERREGVRREHHNRIVALHREGRLDEATLTPQEMRLK